MEPEDICKAPKDRWILIWCGFWIVGKWFQKPFRQKRAPGWYEDGVNPIFNATHWLELPKDPTVTP